MMFALLTSKFFKNTRFLQIFFRKELGQAPKSLKNNLFFNIFQKTKLKKLKNENTMLNLLFFRMVLQQGAKQTLKNTMFFAIFPAPKKSSRKTEIIEKQFVV